MAPLAGAVAAINPLMELAITDLGLYKRALHVSGEGEWNWDTDFKSNPAFVPRFGWGRAILAGQGAVAKGLHIDTPVLTLISTRSDFSRTWNDDMHGSDLVLDVRRIGAAALHLGDLVTIRRVRGAVHDVMLSRAPVREVIFDEIDRWLDAYVRPEGRRALLAAIGTARRCRRSCGARHPTGVRREGRRRRHAVSPARVVPARAGGHTGRGAALPAQQCDWGCGRGGPQDLRGVRATKNAATEMMVTTRCGQGRGRTADLALFRRTLLPAELPGQVTKSDPDGTRTHDLRRDRAAR